MPAPWRTLALTALALLAFAANSVLCRMALKAELIDPVAFTQLRLASGALGLAPFLFLRRSDPHRSDLRGPKLRDWRPAAALFAYAIAFSLAYVQLDAGAGALILFGSVQIAMIGLGAAMGARPKPLEWIGLAVAFAGLAYLASPNLFSNGDLTAPPIGPALLMAAAGAAWGVYSILGRSALDPVGATARNFRLTLPLVALLFFAGPEWRAAEPAGIALAIASGAVTSGLGYVIWYAALRELTPASASIVQLAVPLIAAFGGVALLQEAFGLRLVIAAVLVLGGAFLALQAKAAR